MKRKASDADPEAVRMAVELLQASMFEAIRHRETAVRTLLPATEDCNAAVITAVCMVLGRLLAHQSTSQATYAQGVTFASRILTVNRDRFFAVVREDMRKAKEAGLL